MQRIRKEILSSKFDIRVIWVRSHKNLSGNEIADCYAKMGVYNRPENFDDHYDEDVLWDKRMFEGKIETYINDVWSQVIEKNTLAHTKQVLRKPSKATRDLILSKSRCNIKVCTEAITGHAHLNYHLEKIGLMSFRYCDNCNLSGTRVENQTPLHLFYECPALDHVWLSKGEERRFVDLKSYLSFFEKPFVKRMFKWTARHMEQAETLEEYHQAMLDGPELVDEFSEGEVATNN